VTAGLRRDEAWLKRHLAGVRGIVDARKYLTEGPADANIPRGIAAGSDYREAQAAENLRMSRRLDRILTAGSSKYPVFEGLLRSVGLAPFRTEYQFHDLRLWRLDYAWPDKLVAVEVEGGAFVRGGGGHNRGRGFLEDMEKYNAACMLGWRVFRYPPEMLAAAVADIERAIFGFSRGQR
jgi:hypothetical protein